MLGVNEPPLDKSNMMPYCVDPVMAVVRFVFNFLASLIIVGAGAYMMLNGKKR